MEGIRCVLLDIEGTICPISFVKDTLFPYALNALPEVLANQWNDEAFKAYRDAFPEGVKESPEKLQAHVEDLTKRDVKVSYLKNLQGYLWEDGYETGAYATPLFPDVPPRLKKWKDEGFILAIYSSGSVFAQKLLFGHVKTSDDSAGQKRKRSADSENEDAGGHASPPLKKHASLIGHSKSEDSNEALSTLENGDAPDNQPTVAEDIDSVTTHNERHAGNTSTEDLQPLVTDWFDTTNAGLKTESASYETIANALGLLPANILFLSDNVKEVDAAAAGGMRSVMVDRPGNAPLSGTDGDRLHTVHSLDEIDLALTVKSSKKTNGSNVSTPRKSERLKAKTSQSK